MNKPRDVLTPCLCNRCISLKTRDVTTCFLVHHVILLRDMLLVHHVLLVRDILLVQHLLLVCAMLLVHHVLLQ